MKNTNCIHFITQIKINEKKAELLTAPTRNWRFSASYDSFVVNQTFVFQIKFCGKSPALRVAAKR